MHVAWRKTANCMAGLVVAISVQGATLAVAHAGAGTSSMVTGDIYTVAGNGSGGYTGDGGPATSATLYQPTSVAVDGQGNIYVLDNSDNVVRVVAGQSETLFGQAMTTGDIYTIAGDGSQGFSGDGGPATSAQLQGSGGLAVDSAGNLYIADTFNNRVRVVASADETLFGQAMTTGDIYTIAGNGSQGFSGDGGQATAAALYYPSGVAVDRAGNVYIADGFNARIRVIAAADATLFGQAMTAGDIYTIAGDGTWGYSGSGGAATSADLDYPDAVTVDSQGNVYIANEASYTVQVLAAANETLFGQAMTAGGLYTIAGDESQGYAGDGGPGASAALGFPSGVAVDSNGNVYIADPPNYAIRMVAAADETRFGQNMATGDIYTVVGNGTSNYTGDGGPAFAAALGRPVAVAFDGAGNLYIADPGDYVIRMVAAGPVVSGLSPSSGSAYGGSAVTITGSGFAAGATVDFGTQAATNVVVNAPTSITATAPPGSGTQDVTVTAGGVTSAGSSADQFAYLTPTAVTLALASAVVTPGGTVTAGGTVYDAQGAVVPGATVDVAVYGGNAVVATTDGFGDYTVTLAAPTATGGANVTATLAGTSPAVSASAGLTVVGGVSIGVSPQSVPVGGTAQVSGVVTGGSATVDLSLTGGSGTGGTGSISPATVSSDVYGNYAAEFTAPDEAGAVTVEATVYGAVYTAQAIILVTPQGTSVVGTGQTAASGGTATASYGDTSVSGSGSGVLSVAQYAGNPVGTAPAGAVKYFDAALSTGNTFPSVTIATCGVSAGDTLGWWDPAASGGAGGWQAVSPAAAYASGCLAFTATTTTSPSLSDLSGTVFALSAPVRATPIRSAAPPTVTAVSPASGTAGTTVTIEGTGFTSGATVAFGSSPAANVIVASATEIEATAPSGSGTVDVTVQAAGGMSAASTADRFTYVTVPAFQDVPVAYWAYSAIETVTAKGIASGFPDGTFQPEAPVTRAQFVKMLVLSLDLKAAAGSTPFTDVSPSVWYAPYVATALDAGIVEGVTPSRFDPEEPLTREEMAVLVARALHLTQTGTLHFTDEGRVGTWALPSVVAVVAGGYMSAFPNGAFEPTGVCTRAQVAAILAQYLADRANP